MIEEEGGVSSALVLAAGNGSRLGGGTPKPALPLLGVPLLARALFTLERAGVTDAWVVLGYEARTVRRRIERIERLGLRVRWLYNERWREPNGLSVLTAREALDQPFILAMSDHLFEPSVVTELSAGAHHLRGIDLAVDRNLDRTPDLDEATKVRLVSDRIVAIGKSLEAFDAVDTGVFLATPALFEALGESVMAGEASLSDGVQRLAEAGLARATDIGDRMWHDVDTPEDVEAAERKLLAGLGKPTDGPVARRFNRPVSIALSRRLADTPVTPNQVSVGTLAIGLASAAFAAVGGYLAFLASGILFHLASVLDGVDGELATLTHRRSRRGEWVDTVCDQVAFVAFLVGLTVGVYRTGAGDLYFWSGIVGVAVGAVSMASISLHLWARRAPGSALAVRYDFQEGEGWWKRAYRRVFQYLGKRDLMAMLVLLLAVVGHLPAALVLFAAGGTFLLLPQTLRAGLPALRAVASRVGLRLRRAAGRWWKRRVPGWLQPQ